MKVIAGLLSGVLLGVTVAAKAAPIEEPAAGPPVLREVFESIPAGEINLPQEIRANGREFFVVPLSSERTFWILDADSKERRKIVVSSPKDIVELRIRCVDRIDEKHLVVSASWVEQNVARSGLLFVDEAGNVDRRAGYGLSVRSIVVGPTREWIAGSIQEPRDPTAELDARPTGAALGNFDRNGKLLARQSMNAGNIHPSFEHMLRRHRERKVELVRDTVALTYPFTTSISRSPSVFVLNGYPFLTEAMRKASVPADYSKGGWVRFKAPKLAGGGERRAYAVGIVPIVREGQSGYVVFWADGSSAAGENGDGASRSGASLLAAYYGAEGSEPERVEEIPAGVHVGELSASAPGRAYAVTYKDASVSWTISEIEF